MVTNDKDMKYTAWWTYLLAAIITIVDPFLYQVEIHLGRDDTAIIWSNLHRHPLHEALDVLLLLLHEVFQRVDKFYFFFANKHVHGFGDGLDLVRATILHVPEADPFALILINGIMSSVGATMGPGWAMLGHLSHAAMATPSWVHFNTLDVLPKGVSIQSGLCWAVTCNYPHSFYCVLVLQENFECLVNNSSLQGFHVPFIFFSKDGLWNQKVRQLVRENIDLKLNRVGICRNWTSSLLICWINDS